MSDSRPDGGFTLVELLITMLLMGVAVVAVLGALQVGIVSGDVQRRLAKAELALRSFAEHVKGAAYVDCATTEYAAYAAPDGFSVAVLEVGYWDGLTAPGTPLSFTPAPCTADAGLQRVRVRVTSSDAVVQLETELVKRRT